MRPPLCALQAEQWYSQQASKRGSAVTYRMQRKLNLVSLRHSSSKCRGDSLIMYGAVQPKPSLSVHTY